MDGEPAGTGHYRLGMYEGDEIELSVDPRDDLPDELVRELEFAAFSPETSGEGNLLGLLAEAFHHILYSAEQSDLRTRVIEALSQPGLALAPRGGPASAQPPGQMGL